MGSNFVILYNGREGSSAIINSLSGQPCITVPLMEELDSYIYSEKFKARDLPDTLDTIFSTGKYAPADMVDTHLQRSTSKSDAPSVGFKWRLFGDLNKIAEVFVKHNVTVYSLFRKNFIDITCSAYVHAYGNKLQSDVDMMSFPQFKALEASPDERDAYFKSLSEQHFKLVRHLFLHAAYRQIKTRTQQKQKLVQLHRAGVKMKSIYYEDFDRAPEAFIQNMVQEICGAQQGEFNPDCDFKKVHARPLAERVTGLEGYISGVSGLPYRLMRGKYDAILQDIAGLA